MSDVVRKCSHSMLEHAQELAGLLEVAARFIQDERQPRFQDLHGRALDLVRGLRALKPRVAPVLVPVRQEEP